MVEPLLFAAEDRANATGKLIPVKTAAIGYDQIPPPFNVLDTSNVEDRPRLVEAVQAKLARPSVEPGRLFRARAKTRQELLSWCGIIGAVLTVTANLSGLANVAQWAKWLFAHWLDVVSWFWKTLLFFLPQLTADDTSLLAIVLFLSINIAACLRPGRATNSFWEAFGCLLVGGLIVGSIYVSAFDRVMSGPYGPSGTIFDWLWIKAIAPFLGIDTTHVFFPEGALSKVLAASLVVLAVGTTCLLVAGSVILRWLAIHIDTKALLDRLLRIAVGVAILAGLSWGYELAEKALAGM